MAKTSNHLLGQKTMNANLAGVYGYKCEGELTPC